MQSCPASSRSSGRREEGVRFSGGRGGILTVALHGPAHQPGQGPGEGDWLRPSLSRIHPAGRLCRRGSKILPGRPRPRKSDVHAYPPETVLGPGTDLVSCTGERGPAVGGRPRMDPPASSNLARARADSGAWTPGIGKQIVASRVARPSAQDRIAPVPLVAGAAHLLREGGHPRAGVHRRRDTGTGGRLSYRFPRRATRPRTIQ
jgi:hypothetical protein